MNHEPQNPGGRRAGSAGGGRGIGAPACAHNHAARAGATIDPSTFVRTISNPWLPYRPGSVWVYRGIKDGRTQRDVVTVTHRTKLLMGVRCEALTDVARHGNTVLERTTDWYAQDSEGNVWYFGERTADYADGHVDHSGMSSRASIHGAQPGIVMTAHPAVGRHAPAGVLAGPGQDQYWLVDLGQRASVPYGSSATPTLTLEWSRLEPNVIDRKQYVRGIGVVVDGCQGPPETASLVSFRRP